MPDTRSRPTAPAGRSSRRAWLFGCAVAMAAAAIGAATSSTTSSHTTAQAAGRTAAPALQSYPLDSSTASPGGTIAASAPAGADPQAAAVDQPSTALPVAPTMSMDAPIQGGLTARQEQAVSARLLAAHQDSATARGAKYWTPAMGRTAVARAQSWLGMPYSWAGGDASGPTAGQCAPDTGGDLDCHVVGFDCSGLMMYAWGPYLSLPHLADTQLQAGGFHPSLTQLLPGDMVFFSGYLPSGIGHVAIYAGDGMVLEAPQSGSVIRRSPLSELMASDGTYRGAVRPMTDQTPTLRALDAPVSTAGGTVTLRGAHLAGVDAVHLGGVTVQRFVQHTDSTIVFRTPAHGVGVVAMTVSTSWRATSQPVALSYAKPRSVAPPTAGTPTTPPASSPSGPPASTSPTDPGSSTPTGPGSTPPSSSSPTDPGSSTPTDPGSSTPTDPGSSTPTNPASPSTTPPSATESDSSAQTSGSTADLSSDGSISDSASSH